MATFRLERSTDANGVSERIVDDHGVIALVKARGKRIEAGPLLAAAPDMLTELRDILDFAVSERSPLRDQEIASIQDVIAKAEGR